MGSTPGCALLHDSRFRHLLTGLALAFVACRGAGGGVGASRATGSHGSAKVGGQVVSTVDGHPITIGEVQALVDAGLQPREALLRLQAERLLMVEAARRDLERDPEVRQVARQAGVQALLEGEVASVVVSDDDIRRAYEKDLARFVRPPRRASVHVLAQLPRKFTPEVEAAAKAYAQRVLPALASATDLDAFVAEQNRQKPARFGVIAERIPPMDEKAKLVRPYLDALFSLPAPGVVAQPVRTIYGWHAVRVTEILATESTPYEEAAKTLRAELQLSRQQERMQQLIDKLRAQYGVKVSDNVGQTLARLEL